MIIVDVVLFQTDLLDANCYLVINQGYAIVIDPSGIDMKFIEYINNHKAKLTGIIDTHGHIDHIMGNGLVKQNTNATLMIHEADSEYLTNPDLNLSIVVLGKEYTGPDPDRLLQDGDQIKLGDQSIEIMHTPGHTPGGICLKGPGFLISGDTLFQSSIGRSDLPGGNPVKLKASIDKLKMLHKETVVYPGHGESTTIKRELKMNPFMR